MIECEGASRLAAAWPGEFALEDYFGVVFLRGYCAYGIVWASSLIEVSAYCRRCCLARDYAHANAHVVGFRHLFVRDVACSPDGFKDGQDIDAVQVDDGCQVVG